MSEQSNQSILGQQAPDFTLTNVITNKPVSLNEAKSKIATVIMFICNHCPYVKHIQYGLIKLANDYQDKNVSLIAICSNDAKSYPDDAPSEMKKIAIENHYPFPYLHDETQKVAKAYDAQCTPEFFVLDAKGIIRYCGQFDDSRPTKEIPITGNSLRTALDHLLQGKKDEIECKPAMGCSIKWKPHSFE